MTWVTRLFGAKSSPGDQPLLGAVRFATTGLRVDRRAPDRIEWADLDGDRVSALAEHAVTPSVLTWDIDALRAEQRTAAAARQGGIVSVDLIRAAALPVVQAVTKIPDGLGHVYEGSLLVPLAGARVTLTVSAREHGTTGVREATITGLLLSHGVLKVPSAPAGPGGGVRVQGWFFDPYDGAHDDRALCTLADDERLDPFFERHPLSKVRRWLRTIAQSLVVDSAVRPVISDDAWAPSSGATRLADHLPVVSIALLGFTAGQPALAESVLATAVPPEAGVNGEQGPEAAERLTFLGLAREMQGKFAEVQSAFDRSHVILRAAVGDGDMRTARAACHAGRMRVAQDNLEDAEPLLRAALGIFEAMRAPSDQAIAMNDLGLIAQRRHDHRSAVTWFEQAARHFELAEQDRAPIPDRAVVLNNLAVSLQELGDRRAAAAARAGARAVQAAVMERGNRR